MTRSADTLAVTAPVRLTGPRIVLREFRRSDAPHVSAIVGDPEVTCWLSFDTRDPAGAVEMLSGILRRAEHTPRHEFYLAAACPETDRVLGFVRLARTGPTAKLGYAVRRDAWGRGVATESARLLLSFGFDHLDVHRVTAAVGPDNQASVRVVSSLGFSYEGRLRDHVLTNGAWRDSLLFSLLREEWKP